MLILAVVDFIWLRSSYGKLAEGKFVGGMSATLTKFASNNPYPFIKNFLQTVAIPNSTTFGLLTMYGEALTAIAMLLGIVWLWKNQANRTAKLLLGAGLAGGLFLNSIFWLSSGWTSASTDGLNLLMAAVQLISLVYLAED